MSFPCYCALIYACVFSLVNSYEVPEPTICVFQKGFRVSVPDEDGIQLIAFHGNINKNMYGLDAGQFSKDITKKHGNEWVFEEFDTTLHPGDVIYYWVYVKKHGLGYRYDNGEYAVKDKKNRPYTVPEPRIEIFDEGFNVTIPHQEGIELFAFHGKVNEAMADLEAGHYSKDILEKKGNNWTFEDKNTKLKDGDIIYYWLFVIKDKLGYRYDNGKFRVTVPQPKCKEIDNRMSEIGQKLVPKSNDTSEADYSDEDLQTNRSTTTESLEKLQNLNKIWIR